MTDKIRVDMADLTLAEMAEVGETVGETLDVALAGPRQPLAVAAVAWVVRRRSDPTFTYEAAKQLRLGDIEMIGADAHPEAPGASNGASPQPSPASGVSTPSTS